MPANVIFVLLWAGLASAAGATPNRWHRAIAYSLMVAFVPIAWMLYQDFGIWAVAGFLALALFQLRLLMIHWLKRLVAHMRNGMNEQ
ncbi:MAG TPA: DUF2484 family protein [Paracoccaceae bacterium]|nr:DUF2484 family protein [Paracoccaceae bacterium]